MPTPQNKKKPRKIHHIEDASERIYIFCEGVQTEPSYFEGFKKAIQSNAVYKNLVHVHIEGVGAETLRVIYAAENYVRENQIENATIWCVYDQDSFPKQNFNSVSQYAKNLNKQQNKVNYQVAWSNQCIEYWFILHFDLYTSDNDRKYYRSYLHNKFRELGYPKYEKNNKEIFDILTKRGNPKRAIKWAQKQLNEFSGQPDSDCAPATRVHLLVEALSKYLPEQYKNRYI